MKKVIPVSFMLLFCILILLVQITLINQAKNTLPTAICFRSQDGMNVSFDEIKELKDVTAVAQRNATIATTYNDDNEKVNLWYTNENYFEVANFKCKYGSFFEAKSGVEQNRFIVISNQLALRYFKTDKVIGQSMLIDNQIYTICGVYEQKQALLNQLAQQKLSTIYMPYQSYTGKEPLLPQLILVKSNSQFIKSAYDYVQNQIPSYLNYDSVTNYNDILRLIRQTIRLSIAACGIVVLIILIILLIRQSKKSYQLYRMDGFTREFYKAIALIGILVAVGILTIFLTQFNFFLPADWTPKENIFDLNFYKEQLKSVFQMKNTIMVYDPFLNYSYISMFTCGVLSIMLFLNFVVLLLLCIPIFTYLKKKFVK
ncbi:ABC transporter permease [Paludicola sp. MB14-C6]|uniref:ABC transporter permease n=1 Tax=Paludihabitans sp. MB14-C6 TaxID=3070656 RepID=UPI0027DE01D8|nr:ABC transporter permease [Paludicola sp. MB14-C6]WMJ22347.1 ABC transporter permease [Paludicola sp. MB14-C6]